MELNINIFNIKFYFKIHIKFDFEDIKFYTKVLVAIRLNALKIKIFCYIVFKIKAIYSLPRN